LGRRRRRREDAQPPGLRPRARAASFRQAHHHLLAAVTQVQRVGVSLAAVAEDGDLPPAEVLEVRVLVVIDLGHGYDTLSAFSACPLTCSPPSAVPPRTIATLPVRTISRIPRGRSNSTRPSTFSLSPVISTIPSRPRRQRSAPGRSTRGPTAPPAWPDRTARG